MPRPIKKKIRKPRLETENEIQDLLSRTKDRLSGRSRAIAVAAATAVVLAVLAVGYGLYMRSLEEKAAGLLFEGYKNYHGLYEAEKLPKAERLNRALDGFRKSYETKASPAALYYAAASLDALGRQDEALKELDEFGRKFSADQEHYPVALFKRASIEMKKGDNAAALKSFEELAALKAASYRDIALFESARLLELQDKRHEAVAKYLSIAENFPMSPYAEAAKQRAGLTNAAGAGRPEGGTKATEEKGAGVANQPRE